MKHTILIAFGLAALLAAPSVASAQSFRLDRHVTPMTPGDGLRLDRPVALGEGHWSALLSLDYAHDPLALSLGAGNEERTGELVQHQLVAQARFAYGLLDRLTLSGGMDVGLVMSGESYTSTPGDVHLDPADGPAAGDARIGARYVPWGDADSPWQVAVQAELLVPTQRSQNLTGEGGLAVAPAVTGEVRTDAFRLTLEIGAFFRQDGRVAATEVGDELRVGLGGAVPLTFLPVQAEVLVELQAASGFGDLLGRESTSVELLGGARWLPTGGFGVTLGGGAGLSSGVGTPDARALLSVGYTAE